jgi:thioredoxin 1
MVLEVTDATFDNEVLKAPQPVMIDFWATWCGPCRMVGPIVEKVSEAYKGKVKFCKIDVDKNPQTAAKYRVMSIPTLMFFKNGQVVDTVIGAVPERTMTQKIDTIL